MAGLAAGSYVGVAPSARLIGLKVLNAQGQGTTDDVIRAIEFAIAIRTCSIFDVINLSLGHPIFEAAATDPLVQAVEHASRAGIVVVVSAGNFGRNRTTGQIGYAGIASPGNAPSGISVGSVQTFDTVSRDDDRIAPLQLARSVVVRRVCQAGHLGAGRQSPVGRLGRKHAARAFRKPAEIAATTCASRARAWRPALSAAWPPSFFRTTRT